MNERQVLDLVGGLCGRKLREVFDAGRPLGGTELRAGLYRGRNGGGPAPAKWVARRVVKREWFAKLVLDGFGVNVRCRQDGSHALRPSAGTVDGVVVDLPFRLTAAGLDYETHIAGHDIGALQFRDVLAGIEIGRLAELVDEGELGRVGARRREPHADRELVIGLMAPAGVRALAGMPFGMIWERPAAPGEEASARALVTRRRLFDTSSGRVTP